MNCQTFSTGLSGALGRQRDERDIRRHDELVGQVPTGLVEDEQSVTTRRHCQRDLGQMQVHRRDVAEGQDKGRALAVLGADRADGISLGGALIVRRGGLGWNSPALVVILTIEHYLRDAEKFARQLLKGYQSEN